MKFVVSFFEYVQMCSVSRPMYYDVVQHCSVARDVLTGVFQLDAVCRRASLGVFQLPWLRWCFRFMFLGWAQNHCRFIIFAFDGLHFFGLSELSGFLGSLFAVVSRVLVSLHFDVFQESTQVFVSVFEYVQICSAARHACYDVFQHFSVARDEFIGVFQFGAACRRALRSDVFQ